MAEGVFGAPGRYVRQGVTEAQKRILMRRTRRRKILAHHPATGGDLVYLSPATRIEVQGTEMDLAELEPLIEKLAWPHHWQPHEVLIWDNLRWLHRRPAFTGSRTLQRIQFAPAY